MWWDFEFGTYKWRRGKHYVNYLSPYTENKFNYLVIYIIIDIILGLGHVTRALRASP